MSTFVVDKLMRSEHDETSRRVKITVDNESRSMSIYTQVLNGNGVPLVSTDVWRGHDIPFLDELTQERLSSHMDRVDATYWNMTYPRWRLRWDNQRFTDFFSRIARPNPYL